jgi:hypothetical protein
MRIRSRVFHGWYTASAHGLVAFLGRTAEARSIWASPKMIRLLQSNVIAELFSRNSAQQSMVALIR